MSGAKKFFINKKSGVFLNFLIGAVALLIFLIILNFFSAPIRNSFFAFSSPVQKVFWTAGESSSFGFSSFLHAGDFAKQNEDLKTENQKLLEQISSLQSVISANKAQSDISAVCQSNGFDLKMAAVMGFAGKDALSINKGSGDGIAQGMPVINQQKALVGVISKVYSNFSQITLISNKNSVISVKILQKDSTQSEIDGAIKGSGGLGIYLDLVPIDQTIKEGDVLVTSALEGTFPKDLLVGTITKVEKNDQNPHQKAQVQPFFNANTDDLFVITNYKR